MLGECLGLACTAPVAPAPLADPTQVAEATYVAEVQARIGTATKAETWSQAGVHLRRDETMRFSRGSATVDLATGEDAVAIKQRSDVCAVPAGGVDGEAVVAFELANAVLEKFGGDALAETRRNLDAFVETLP